jgi:capsular exopolysaccharide synthesis family protein
MTNEIIVNKNPKSSVSEAIRIIRTNIEFSGIDKKVKTILITSSIPSEGKSFISANLATAFAQNNSQVLLVDCDMRKGRLHKMFGIENERGLSNLLLGDVESEFKLYIKKTNIDNLYLLPKGIVPPNPSELLNSSKTKNLLKVLSERFDYLILDGTPVNGLTDSLILTKYVDKTIIVASLNYTKSNELEFTKKSLLSVGADIAGVIVNRVPDAHSSYYGNYYE